MSITKTPGKITLPFLIILTMTRLSLAAGPSDQPVDWTEQVNKVKPQMRRMEVEKILPLRYAGQRHYGKDGFTESYWLDDNWFVTLFYEFDNIHDENGKVSPNVGNNSLGKVLSLESREHPAAQLPKSSWTHANALELVLDFQREAIKELENGILPKVPPPEFKWTVTHVPSYGGAVIAHLFVVTLKIGNKKKATWNVNLYSATVELRDEKTESEVKAAVRPQPN